MRLKAGSGIDGVEQSPGQDGGLGDHESVPLGRRNRRGPSLMGILDLFLIAVAVAIGFYFYTTKRR
ncbi:hypothetical protein [Candidatus Poriferisocius sp.]|uniref:hypothetical protein n=1 Tax=Candidatus Poriferisocius sp. TaxID=3101276 RepID=UPI003B0255C2